MAHNGVRTTQGAPGRRLSNILRRNELRQIRATQDNSRRLKTTQDDVASGSSIHDGGSNMSQPTLSKPPSSLQLRAERLARSRHTAEEAPDITQGDSRHSGTAPVIVDQTPDIRPEEDPALLAIAEPARTWKRLSPPVVDAQRNGSEEAIDARLPRYAESPEASVSIQSRLEGAMNSPIPSPHQIRAKLKAMVLGDLLGPAGGDDTLSPSDSAIPVQFQGD